MLPYRVRGSRVDSNLKRGLQSGFEAKRKSPGRHAARAESTQCVPRELKSGIMLGTRLANPHRPK